MNLDMWFKDDIRNVLIGIEFASAQAFSNLTDSEQLAFRNGFCAALLAVAASFGIVEREPPTLTQLRPPMLDETNQRLPHR